VGRGDLAEELATYAFYFLASGAILLIIHKICGKPKHKGG